MEQEQPPEQRKFNLPRPTIHVTKEQIEKACKANTKHCMIAEAIRDNVSRATRISVDLMTIRWSDNEKGLRYTYNTPRNAQEALLLFDAGEPIEPFEFRVINGNVSPVQSGRGSGITKKKEAPVKIGAPSIKITKTGTTTVTKKAPGMTKPWHPSHNSLRAFGLQGFTKGWMPRPKEGIVL